MSKHISEQKIKALLLAGGIGSRLRPLTDTTPKCLVDIGGKPLIQYWFDALKRAGVNDVMINTHHLPDPVREYFAVKQSEGVNAVEFYEPELLGSAGTIAANRDWADDADHVLIVYADNLSDINLADLIRYHRSHDDPMTTLLFHAPVPEACGIAELDDENRIVSFVEKPEHPKSDLANAGLYVVTSDAWREIADLNAFDIGYDVLPRFVGRMRGHTHGGYHRDIGTHEALVEARQAVASLAIN